MPTECSEVPDYKSLSLDQKKQRLQELAIVFTKLGAIAFGGPAAHIAMIDDEVVKRRQWMSQAKLLDLLGITNLIPGPNSTELAIHIGLERAGWLGLIVAGVCFILPAMLIVWSLAAVYVQSQTLPQVGWLLYGIKPVIIAIVLQALWKLGQKAIKDKISGLVCITTIALAFLGVNEIALLLMSGLVTMLSDRLATQWQDDRNNLSGFWLIPTGVSHFALLQTPETRTWANVFLLFLKIGSVLYGSGYVLLAFLQKDLVERTGWLTSQQLLDAIAVGQFTPGPVFTTATFVGYLVAGNAGAIAATVGIFLPAFILVALVNPWVAKLRQWRWTGKFLDGVNAASLGLMALVTWQLGMTALVDILTVVLAILAAIALFRFKLNSIWLILVGGIIGFLSQLWR